MMEMLMLEMQSNRRGWQSTYMSFLEDVLRVESTWSPCGMHSPSISGRIPGMLDAFGREKHGIHHGVPRKSMLTSRVLQEAGSKHSA